MSLKKILILCGAALVFILAFILFAQLRSKPAPTEMEMVEELINKQKLKEAAQFIGKIVASGSVISPETLYHYARVYAQAGEKGNALRLLNHAIDKGFRSINRFKVDKELNVALGPAVMEQVLNRIRVINLP